MPGPKSVLEGIDWNVLGQMMGGKAMGLGRFQFACFLTNEVRAPPTRHLLANDCFPYPLMTLDPALFIIPTF